MISTDKIKKLELNEYEPGTTVGTGILNINILLNRLFRSCKNS